MPPVKSSTIARAGRPRGLRPPVRQPEATTTVYWPGSSWGDLATPYINETTALGLPAAWFCANLIANGVASMSPPFVLAADELTRLPVPPIVRRPNAMFGRYEFWHAAVAHAICRGNFVGILADWGPDGFARQVVPVNWSMCHVNAESGFPVYEIGGRDYHWSEVVHVRGYTLPGSFVGIGVVENFRRGLGASLDQANMAANTYSTGSVPSGIIKVKQPEVSQEQADDVADQWIDKFGSGSRRPAVLPELFDFTPISWSPEDAQFLQSRQFSIAEIALMFGLEPVELGAAIGGPSITYQNVQHRQLARQLDAYGPWAERFGDAWSDLIPGGGTVTFDESKRLKTDMKSRFEALEVGLRAGVITNDEARAIDRRLPLATEPAAPTEEPA